MILPRYASHQTRMLVVGGGLYQIFGHTKIFSFGVTFLKGGALVKILMQYLAQLGYRIRGPVPSYAEVEKLRSTNAALNEELFTLADKNKALHDRIAKLEAVLQIIKDECRMEMHTPHEAPFTLAYTRDLASEALELDAT